MADQSSQGHALHERERLHVSERQAAQKQVVPDERQLYLFRDVLSPGADQPFEKAPLNRAEIANTQVAKVELPPLLPPLEAIPETVPSPEPALSAAKRVRTTGRVRIGAKAKPRLPGAESRALVDPRPTRAAPIEAQAPLYLGVRSVARRYDVSVASIWRWVAAGKFPKPHKIACGTTRWSVADLDAHDRTPK